MVIHIFCRAVKPLLAFANSCLSWQVFDRKALFCCNRGFPGRVLGASIDAEDCLHGRKKG